MRQYNSTLTHSSTFFGNTVLTSMPNRFSVAPLGSQNLFLPTHRKSPNHKTSLTASTSISESRGREQRWREDCVARFNQLFEKTIYSAKSNSKDLSKIGILINTINNYFNHYCPFKEACLVEEQDRIAKKLQGSLNKGQFTIVMENIPQLHVSWLVMTLKELLASEYGSPQKAQWSLLSAADSN